MVVTAGGSMEGIGLYKLDSSPVPLPCLHLSSCDVLHFSMGGYCNTVGFGDDARIGSL
jgi:hypothetical protein